MAAYDVSSSLLRLSSHGVSLTLPSLKWNLEAGGKSRWEREWTHVSTCRMVELYHWLCWRLSVPSVNGSFSRWKATFKIPACNNSSHASRQIDKVTRFEGNSALTSKLMLSTKPLPLSSSLENVTRRGSRMQLDLLIVERCRSSGCLAEAELVDLLCRLEETEYRRSQFSDALATSS